MKRLIAVLVAVAGRRRAPSPCPRSRATKTVKVGSKDS